MKVRTDGQPGVLPNVTDDDIADVEGYLGISFDGPRREILRSNETLDVQACPGSGKTTLLVAKLAILAKKWPHSRRGICVLSHTNVARQEVESKLAGTIAGQRLLNYPHFVGTIHSFVNEFFALPLLRSEGHAIRMIDDDICGDFCELLLNSDNTYLRARLFLKKRHEPERTIRGLRFEGLNLDLGTAGPALRCGAESASYQQLFVIKRRASERGLWRHDDMLAWAEKLLAQHADVAEYARWRFPVVFIDEMQDTSEAQSRVLARVFAADVCTVRQRFGDPNQAIYDFGQSRATTDPFPSGRIRTLPNSKRFGSQIAKKAEPLAVVTPDPELKGEGPGPNIFAASMNPATMPHTVFCFNRASTNQVLPAFGKLLLETFPDPVLCSDTFVARVIGRIGKSGGEEARMPRNLGDYWTAYEPRAAMLEPRPQTLADFLHLAQRKRGRAGDCADAVQAVAKGLIELVGKIMPMDAVGKARGMRWLRESMSSDESALRNLQCILWQWCVELVPVSEQGWLDQMAAVRDVLRPVSGEKWPADAVEFCKWSGEFAGEPTDRGPTIPPAPNRYTFSEGGRAVDIDVGTIHGAKGQTHTATLVLETFFKKHDFTDLMPWLIGHDSKPKRGSEREDRMRLIYTAMTRPTHLLCLAIRDEALGNRENRPATIDCLRSAGWQVTHL